MVALNFKADRRDAADEVLQPDPELCWPLLASLDQIHLVAIPAIVGTNTPVKGREFGTDIAAAVSWALERNDEGFNIYWTVNAVGPGLNWKPAKHEIEAARFAHVDIDPPANGDWDPDQVLADLASLEASPSFVIHSGNGLQAFWRLEYRVENAVLIEPVNRGIVARFSGDACWNLDRVMRLPGFINWPNQKKLALGRVPALATMAVEDDGVIYDLETLAQAFPAPVQTAAVSAGPSRPDVSSEIEYLTCDDLKLGKTHQIRLAVERPPQSDRSGDMVAAARLMAREGYSDETIAGILLNPENPISAHALSQRDPLRAAYRAIDKVRQTPDRASGAKPATQSVGAAEESASGDTTDLAPYLSLDLVALAKVKPRHKEFAIERLAPVGEVTLFTGPGSVGKSLLGQQMATCAAAGLDCLGLKVKKGPAIYLTCEDDSEQLHFRQAMICDALGVPMADLAGKLHLISLRGGLENELGTFAPDGKMQVAPAYYRLEATIKASGAKIVFLDNVAHLFTGNENDRIQVTRFVNLLNRLAGATGAALILVAHPPKAGAPNAASHDYSGSTAWLNSVRSQFKIDRDRVEGVVVDRDARTMTVGKANYTATGETFKFRWFNWAFVLEEELPRSAYSEMDGIRRALADQAMFRACLTERVRQRRAVSEKRSSTFAPKVFAAMPESKGIGPKRLEAAMEQLLRTGEIERGELWRGPDRKPVFGLRFTAGDGAGDCAGDTVRETRETVPEMAENLAGDAG